VRSRSVISSGRKPEGGSGFVATTLCCRSSALEHRKRRISANHRSRSNVCVLDDPRRAYERPQHTRRPSDAAEDFLKSVQYQKTRSRYRSSINNFLRHFGERIRLSEVTPESIFRFQQKRLEEGAGKATVNRDVATISSLMSRARKMRLISHNPCSDVGRLNERRGRRQATPLSYEEETRVKHFSPAWLSVLITLLVETGLRVRKEALPLKWRDVMLDSDPACIH
jgi:integrase